MFLHISDSMTVEDVQDRFRECFPSLDLVFYRTPNKKWQGLDKSEEVSPRERIAYIRDNHYNGVLEIKSWHAVAKVEEALSEMFGLNAQIVRKGLGDKWIANTLNSNSTLADQARLYEAVA